EVRSNALFRIILGSLKPSIKESARRMIKKDSRNEAEIWTVLENEYGAYRLDTRNTICDQISTINLRDFNNDIIKYIARFRKLTEKLKALNSELPQFYVVNRFIAGLNDYQSAHVHTEMDKIRDVKDKSRLAHLDLEVLMNQLTSRA